MRCIICDARFDFDKEQGINFRNKPICDECLVNLTFVCLDKYKNGLKRYLKQEIKLEYYT